MKMTGKNATTCIIYIYLYQWHHLPVSFTFTCISGIIYLYQWQADMTDAVMIGVHATCSSMTNAHSTTTWTSLQCRMANGAQIPRYNEVACIYCY